MPEVRWPGDVKHHYRVFYPVNTQGTTWLRESDLVFMDHKPYAVLSWSQDQKGEHPQTWIELNPKMLKHDLQDGPVYRYEGEVQDPAG